MDYELEDRNITNTTPHKIPFEFVIQLPKPQKDRLIVLRDELGRILKAETPRQLFAKATI